MTESQINRPRRFGIGRWLPGVVISAIALVAVFKFTHWQDLSTAIQAIQPVYLAAAIGLTLLSLITKSMTWRTLLDNRVSIWKTFFIVNEGYLLNNIFPLRAGEIGRAVFMGQTSGLGAFHVLSTIVIERAFDIGIAAGLLLATLPMALGMEWAKSAAVITLGLVVAGFVALFFMANNRERVHQMVGWLGQKSGLIQRWIVPQLESLLRGFEVLTRPSQFFASLFWVVVTWIIWVSIYYVMLLSIAPGAPLWWGAFVDSFLAMGLAMPSAPAGIGVFEASMVASMALLGIPSSSALAYAITMHAMQFVITGILGLFGLIREGRSIKNLFSKDLKQINHQQTNEVS